MPRSSGSGCSAFGRGLPDSQLRLAAVAFKEALADAGLEREDVDGLSIHLGAPLGVDYDRVAEGLRARHPLREPVLAARPLRHQCAAARRARGVGGLADVVACVTAVSFTRERGFLGGPGDVEGNREEGGTHGEAPPYGLTAPAGGAAIAMQRYMHLYGATSEQLAAVPMSIRQHALNNPRAIMREPLTLEAHQKARMVVDPLRLFDCCLISDGAAIVLVTRGDRARDLKQKPVRIAAMQGMRSGRDEFIFAPRGLGINQQSGKRAFARERDLEIFTQGRGARRRAGLLHLRRVLAAGAVCARALRLLRRRRSGGVRAGRTHRARRRAAGEHLRRPVVRGACRGLEFDLRDDAAIARHGGREPDQGRGGAAMGHGVGRQRDPDEGRMSHEKPRPRIGPDSAPFWQGCRAHRLMLPTCSACGKAHLPPGPVCPFCFADAIEWRAGERPRPVSTWTAVHKAWFPAFAAETPYNVIQVELDEGPRLTSNLIGGDKPAIGQRVEVVFDDVDAELTLHRFRVV